MKKIDDLILCWLAGLFEGEAYFGITSVSGHQYPYIAMEMTDEEIVARVATLFGHKYTSYTPKKVRWNTTYKFTLKGSPAAGLMERFRPIMGQRRQGQIDRALKDYVYNSDGKLNNPKITEEQVRAIKKRLATGETAKSIAQDFPISHYAIWDIRSGKTWSHVKIDDEESPKPHPLELLYPPLALNSDEKKLHWVAGLLEAEGSFMASPPSEPNRPRISLPMTDEDIVSRAAEILGVTHIPIRSRNEKHKMVYRAMVRGGQAVEEMRQLFPVMGTRRQAQITRALGSHVEIPVRQGEYHHSAKISEEQARGIKARILNYDNLERIAHDFGVSVSIVREIYYGRTWKHIKV